MTLPDGSILSPSGRSYARHRDKTVGHHISLFIQFLMEKQNVPPPPGEPEMAMREAIRSTTYRASAEVYKNFTAQVRGDTTAA